MSRRRKIGPAVRLLHDQIKRTVEQDLIGKGYHIDQAVNEWQETSAGKELLPDIVATRADNRLLLEVATYETIESAHTKKRLAKFADTGTTYLVIPQLCFTDRSQVVDPLPAVKNILRTWKLVAKVRVVLCDLGDGTVRYDV